MNIELHNLLPVPLKDSFARRTSDIWKAELTFLSGEWIKIKAPSGTGKTTFMHILYKLRHDYEGEVFIGDTNLKTIQNNQLAQVRQERVSVIFQDLRLFENLTARENIELKRVMQKPFYDAKVIDDMAAQLGVQGILNQKAGICSYGEQQRIAIIRSLMQPFKWLIMDEPFSHLDSANTKIAANLVAEECKKRQAGFILTDLDDDDHFSYSNFYNL